MTNSMELIKLSRMLKWGRQVIGIFLPMMSQILKNCQYMSFWTQALQWRNLLRNWFLRGLDFCKRSRALSRKGLNPEKWNYQLLVYRDEASRWGFTKKHNQAVDSHSSVRIWVKPQLDKFQSLHILCLLCGSMGQFYRLTYLRYSDTLPASIAGFQNKTKWYNIPPDNLCRFHYDALISPRKFMNNQLRFSVIILLQQFKSITFIENVTKGTECWIWGPNPLTSSIRLSLF